MAHIAKYTAAACGHLCGHYDRSKPATENIDSSRTEQNYNLAAEQQPLSQIDFIRTRLSEVKTQKRKDLNVMCDWVVTAPKDLPKELQPQFFKETYNYLAAKYGKKNVISAYVHLDEVTPHLHFAFVPVVENKRKGGYKVSAKECITRADLKHFHEDLQNYLEDKLGQPVNIQNGATREGNKSIAELKRGTAAAEFAELQEGIKMSKEQILQVRAMGNVIQKNDLMPDFLKEFNKLKAAELSREKGKER